MNQNRCIFVLLDLIHNLVDILYRFLHITFGLFFKQPYCPLSLTISFILGTVQYSSTRRGRKCLIHEDNIFYINHQKGQSTFWVCSDYYRVKCRSRCVTDMDGNLKRFSNNHIHPPHIDRIREKESAAARLAQMNESKETEEQEDIVWKN